MGVYIGNKKVSLIGGTAPVSYLGTIKENVIVNKVHTSPTSVSDSIPISNSLTSENFQIGIVSTGDTIKFVSYDGSALKKIEYSYPDRFIATLYGLKLQTQTNFISTKEVKEDCIICTVEVDQSCYHYLESIEIGG